MKTSAGNPTSAVERVIYSYTVNIVERSGFALGDDNGQAMFDTMSLDLEIQQRLQETVTTLLESRECTEHLRCNVQE